MDRDWNLAAATAYADDYPGHDAFLASLRDVELDRSLPGTVVISELDDAELVGGAMFRPSFLADNTFDLSWVFVIKKYRGRGYGTRIITESIRQIEFEALRGERGSIMICVLGHHVALYEQFGFVRGANLHDGVVMVRIANSKGRSGVSASIHAR